MSPHRWPRHGKRSLQRALACALVAAGALAPAWGSGPAIVVIAGSESQPAALDREGVAQIFLGRSAADPPWHAIDSSDEALRERFYQSVAGISANRARAHWARLVFSSRKLPPRELGAQESLLEISQDPRAITYVYASQLPRKAHVLLTLPAGD
jgi:hypothetical protein